MLPHFSLDGRVPQRLLLLEVDSLDLASCALKFIATLGDLLLDGCVVNCGRGATRLTLVGFTHDIELVFVAFGDDLGTVHVRVGMGLSVILVF